MLLPNLQIERHFSSLVALHHFLIPNYFSGGVNMDSNLDLQSDALIGARILERPFIPKNQAARVLDIGLILLAAPYIILAFLLITILIRLDSAGPVFYRQARIGRFGRRFHVYKFRTMVQNADQLLQTYLDRSPELKAEWLATHKLKKDPRVTRVGAVLRKTSLDELPQVWNILIGEMSLIGPRPIVDAEVEKYGHCFELYKQVRPGLTGLWQVSGRSDTSYKRRVELDEYYILHRSLKLDLQILWKTVFVVLRKDGAY
jgi:Undecaprenyl-phosphate galactose phosphotransferase WbaP